MIEITEIDLHLVELRYRDTRITRPHDRAKLLQSISTDGLLTPITTIKEGNQFILMDGYLRFDIIKKLGQDTLMASVSEAGEQEALLSYLRLSQYNRHEAIEEGWLVDILVQNSLSYSEIGRRVGKDKSWAQRRHKLVTDLSEELQNAVRKSHISSWSAERILTPLARANTDHAVQLIQKLQETPLSSRELSTWFRHYQEGNQGQRKTMIENPKLLLKTLAEREKSVEAKSLQQGVDGRWLEQVSSITRQLAWLTREIPKILGTTQTQEQSGTLLKAYDALAKQFQLFKDKIHEVKDAEHSNQGNDQTASQQGHIDPPDQPATENISEQCSASVEEHPEQKADPQVAERYLQAARSLLEDGR